MSKNYFLMKAHKATPAKVDAGMEWSIKLDGMRAFWDGGVSRDRSDAPWNPGVQATGLWSNNAKPIYAPDWWLDQLPNYPCDGELWAGAQRFQFVMSVCRRKNPDARWEDIMFVHHTDVQLSEFLTSRIVNEKSCQTAIIPAMSDYFNNPTDQPDTPGSVYQYLEWHDVPYADTWVGLNTLLEDLVIKGHEGIMLRQKYTNEWTPTRSWNLLKLKPFKDMEVTVIGVRSGRKTDKGSRLLGRMGSLVCVYRNKKFNVSGFADHQRDLVSMFKDVDAIEYASDNAGEEMPAYIHSKTFKPGTVITVKYRELTDRGVPKDPRFWRLP